MKTIAQQLKVKEFPFTILDSKGNPIYWETSEGRWYRREWDSRGKEIYYETNTGYWVKRGFDSRGNQIYWETSNGHISDNRPKETIVTMDEIAAKFNILVSKLKIKK